MSDEISALRRQVAELGDREAIRDLLTRIARGLDRFDTALLARCIHADAKLDMGSGKVATGAEFVAMLNPPAAAPLGRMHVVTNTLIALDGDRASGESHVLSCQQIAQGDGSVTRLRAGRYLDRFKRHVGGWMLMERTLVDEWGRVDEVREAAPIGAHRGRPAPDDLLYTLFYAELGR